MTVIIHTGTSGSKRRKRKPTKAELALQAEARKRQAELDAMPRFARTPAPPPRLTPAAGKQTPPAAPARAQSRVTPGGSTAKKATPVYTGDKVLGIAVLHKSCLQPVFTEEQALDVAKMRR